MKRLLLSLLVVAAALIMASGAAGEWLTRPARADIGPLPGDIAAQTVRIAYGDQQHLAGWFLPGQPGAGAVLLLHGVRGNRQQMLARARWLQREGIASLLVDLPSHGQSSGERISFGRFEARGVEAALAWLGQQLPGERLGAIGVSLGGASLLFAQRQPELQALVLESVYPTITDAVHDRLAMRLGSPAATALAPLLLMQMPLRLGLSTDQLRPVEAVRALRVPLLVMSGTNDQHTPWPETQALFNAAPSPKVLWPVQGAAHVDLHAFAPRAYEARLAPWLHARLQRPTCRPPTPCHP